MSDAAVPSRRPASSSTRCALDRGERPRVAVVGRVCAAHLELLGEMLDPEERGQMFGKPEERRIAPSIPVLFEMLDAQPTVGEKLGGGVHGSKPPGDERVMGHRDLRSRATGSVNTGDDERDPPWPVLATLVTIARRLDVRDVHNRPVRLPRIVCPSGAPRSEHHPVRDYAAWLHTRLELLAAVDWIDRLWHDLRTLHNQLRGTNGDPPPPPVGHCWQPVDDGWRWSERGPHICGEPLWLPTQAPKGMDEPVVLPSLRCPQCGWTYTGAELVRLGRERAKARQETEAGTENSGDVA